MVPRFFGEDGDEGEEVEGEVAEESPLSFDLTFATVFVKDPDNDFSPDFSAAPALRDPASESNYRQSC